MITLASDFGTPYPAAMRGVIRRHTDAELIDVAHDFPRQDVRAGAFWLREVLPWFPPAVHCAVVDPGVGTDRAAVVVRVGVHAIVAPDNGLVLPAARRLQAWQGADDENVAVGEDGVTVSGTPEGEPEDDPPIEVFEIDVEDPASSTFHGRDVFAPAAAAVHEAGVEDLADCEWLAPTDEFVDLRFPEPERYEDGIVGEVLAVDDFGNAITNVPGNVLDGRKQVRANGTPVPVGESFATVPVGQWLVTVGSHGNVELAVNRGRGDEAFGVASGDEVTIEL